LFIPLDLANRRSIASPKSALFPPIAASKPGGGVNLTSRADWFDDCGIGKMNAARKLSASAPTRGS
jgi:hypothetical protein